MSAQPSVSPAPEPVTQSDLNHLAQTERTRAGLIEQLGEAGIDANLAGRVAEASIRRARARRSQQTFRYTDVEEQFEALCRSTGAGAVRVEQAKQRVWAVAMGIADRHEVAIEEALFFCYCESLYLPRQILGSVGTAATITGVEPH